VRVIAGSARGRRLVAPHGAAARPTADRVREALFSALGDGRVIEAAVLDLYAGSGALAIEALSRGAARAVIVDRSRDALAAVRANLDTTGFAERARVQRADAVAFAHGKPPTEAPFDLAFVDPPYETPSVRVGDALEGLARPGWLAAGAAIVVERAARGDPYPLPGSWTTAWERAYGDTLVAFAALE
jgi:16S rRNA (guanine966-N2)-methyltransferase